MNNLWLHYTTWPPHNTFSTWMTQNPFAWLYSISMDSTLLCTMEQWFDLPKLELELSPPNWIKVPTKKSIMWRWHWFIQKGKREKNNKKRETHVIMMIHGINPWYFYDKREIGAHSFSFHNHFLIFFVELLWFLSAKGETHEKTIFNGETNPP